MNKNDSNEILLDRREFAAVLGTTKARVVQLVRQGLPESLEGIPLYAGTKWYLNHIAPTTANMRGRAGMEKQIQAAALRHVHGRSPNTTLHVFTRGHPNNIAAAAFADRGWAEGEFHILLDVPNGNGLVERFALCGLLGDPDELRAFVRSLLRERGDLRPYLLHIKTVIAEEDKNARA